MAGCDLFRHENGVTVLTLATGKGRGYREKVYYVEEVPSAIGGRAFRLTPGVLDKLANGEAEYTVLLNVLAIPPMADTSRTTERSPVTLSVTSNSPLMSVMVPLARPLHFRRRVVRGIPAGASLLSPHALGHRQRRALAGHGGIDGTVVEAPCAAQLSEGTPGRVHLVVVGSSGKNTKLVQKVFVPRAS
jgi:hypothetical protein